MNIINTPIKASVEPGGVRLVEVHQPLSKNIGDDPQVLPIVLNGPMQAFKDAPQTDAAVMELQFLRQRQERGEIPAHCNPQALAEYINCILQGMSISAREGATFEQLMQITRTTLRIWPELLKS
ncbi:TPA: hypothetical protein ACH2RR_002135 [Salmonella enterica]